MNRWGARLARLATLAVLGVVTPTLAERADRDKPIDIEANRMTAEDAKQLTVFEGKVVLTQGTFQLRADRLTVQQDKDGKQFAVATGRPATFRTKRDGSDEWIDGEAERIEYDSKTEKVEFFQRARVNRDKDIVRGNYISYDQRTDLFLVQDGKDVAGKPNPGRVSATIQPKPKSAAPGSPAGTPLTLQPSTDMATPRP